MITTAPANSIHNHQIVSFPSLNEHFYSDHRQACVLPYFVRNFVRFFFFVGHSSAMVFVCNDIDGIDVRPIQNPFTASNAMKKKTNRMNMEWRKKKHKRQLMIK